MNPSFCRDFLAIALPGFEDFAVTTHLQQLVCASLNEYRVCSAALKSLRPIQTAARREATCIGDE